LSWVSYSCPVAGAQDAMKAIDESLPDNPLIFPDLAILEKTHQFAALDEATRTKYATSSRPYLHALDFRISGCEVGAGCQGVEGFWWYVLVG